MELEDFLKEDPVKKTKRFMLFVFLTGALIGFLGSVGYVNYLRWLGRWDPSAHLFPAIVIFFGLGFTVPCLVISLRVMFLSLVMSCKAIQDTGKLMKLAADMQEKAGPIIPKIEQVVDNALPMTESVQLVLEKAKAMSEDVVSIAHRVRTVTEQMNGTFNLKTLEEKLDKLATSIQTIAASLSTMVSVFEPMAGIKKEPGNGEAAEFDFLKAGRRRKS